MYISATQLVTNPRVIRGPILLGKLYALLDQVIMEAFKHRFIGCPALFQLGIVIGEILGREIEERILAVSRDFKVIELRRFDIFRRE